MNEVRRLTELAFLMKSHSIDCNTYDLLDRLSMYLKYFSVEHAFVNYLTDILHIRFHDSEEIELYLVRLICDHLHLRFTNELYKRISLYHSVVLSMGKIKMSLPNYVTSYMDKDELLYPNSASELRKIAPTYNQRVLLIGLVRDDPLNYRIDDESVSTKNSIRVLLSVFGKY